MFSLIALLRLPLRNPEKLKSGRASSGSMVSKQIIVFKCVVSLCDQDFGAFCQERDLEGKKRFGEQPGATKPVADELLEALVEAGTGFGGVEWMFWLAPATVVAWGWLAGLRSLLGRLWWHWVFWLWKQCQNGGGGACREATVLYDADHDLSLIHI